MDLRALFNDRKWHTGDLALVNVVVRHRGAPGDVRTVYGREILEITPGGLVVAGREEGGETVFLPWTRVLRVTTPTEVLWDRSASSAGAEREEDEVG